MGSYSSKFSFPLKDTITGAVTETLVFHIPSKNGKLNDFQLNQNKYFINTLLSLRPKNQWYPNIYEKYVNALALKMYKLSSGGDEPLVAQNILNLKFVYPSTMIDILESVSSG